MHILEIESSIVNVLNESGHFYTPSSQMCCWWIGPKVLHSLERTHRDS
jgi:hypothetical protein